MSGLTMDMLTNPGGRAKNEDQVRFFVDEPNERWCCVVADGLGGMGGGAEASECVVNALQRSFESGLMAHDTMSQCLQQAHEALRALQREMRLVNSMLSTAVVLFVTRDRLSWIYSGDSRLYLFHKSEIIHCTKDHSVPRMLADCGDIDHSEIRNHPDRNRLLYCVGMDREQLKASQVETAQLCEGMSALLCTDGFWEPVDEKAMVTDLRKACDVSDWLHRMQSRIGKLPKSEKMDNYTALCLWIRKEAGNGAV